jgi:hypothetical protein
MNTAANRHGIVSMLRVGLVVVVLFSMSGLLAQAGNIVDRGTLPGTPPVGTINYLAWYSTATPPTQVLTEDNWNSGVGPNQGYYLRTVSGVSTPTWRLGVGEGYFSPAPSNGTAIQMLFGGIGAQAGKIWKYSFAWDNVASTTDHLEVGAQANGTCPMMTAGNRSATGKVINWTSSAGASAYAIYRSKLPSGAPAPNQAGNGQYDLVTTVPAGSPLTYTDTDPACQSTGTGCWHIVVPLNGSNQISGCHSEETSPTVVSLSDFTTSRATPGWPLIVGLGALAAVVVGGMAVSRRRAARG